MDLIDELRALGTRIPKQIQHIKTEEATKHAFVLPFIGALGYDVFDPTEVTPELTADVGLKKGEKVDYAILREGEPIILFECKDCSANLDGSHASQLHRYFHVTKARFGVLTNGIVYRFFTDLEEPNKMDLKPFFEFNVLDIGEAQVQELKRFTKSGFNLEQAVSAASELKYTKEIKKFIAEQLVEPSEDFARFMVSKVYSGMKTQKVLAQFTDIIKRALNQFVNDMINERLKTALDSGRPAAEAPPDASADAPAKGDGEDGPKIVTTEEEREAFLVVKAILREVVDPARIFMRDTASYCGVLLDDNNRKPICRFRFGANKLVLSTITATKEEERVTLEKLDDIYKHADRLKATVAAYERAQAPVPA